MNWIIDHAFLLWGLTSLAAIVALLAYVIVETPQPNGRYEVRRIELIWGIVFCCVPLLNLFLLVLSFGGILFETVGVKKVHAWLYSPVKKVKK